MEETNALIQEIPECSLTPSTVWAHREIRSRNQEASPRTEPVGAWVLDFSLQNREKQIPAASKPPCLWEFVTAAQSG